MSRWVFRTSSDGTHYGYIERDMPWIEPEYLHCSVYLYPSEAEAEDGKKLGGSGFLLRIPVYIAALGTRRVSWDVACVVTNKHVIDDGNRTVRVNRKSGSAAPIPLDNAVWFDHPTSDVTLCPIALDVVHEFTGVHHCTLLTKPVMDSIDIGPGDDTFTVGRFIGHDGKQRNTPCIRFGNVAQMPFEPIRADGIMAPQESFLVESRSMPGTSGSPVFVYMEGTDVTNFPGVAEGLRNGSIKLPGINPKRLGRNIRTVWLLGVDWCHLRDKELVWSKLTGKPVSPEWFVKSNSGMMGVIPAWKIQEILDGDDMKKALTEAGEEAKQRHARISDDAVADLSSAKEVEAEPEAANPHHKEDFTRLLNAAVKGSPSKDQT